MSDQAPKEAKEAKKEAPAEAKEEPKAEVKEETTDKVPTSKAADNSKKIPDLKTGYTVKVHQTIKEGKKERVQIFEGIILGIKGSTPVTKTITVYKESRGVGVEKIFPLALPTIVKIEVVKKAKVRQSKLYYLKNYNKRLTEERVSA